MEHALQQLAPTGKLRVALNHGNRVLVGRDDTGTAIGISVDLAREVASRLGVDVTFIHYDRAVEVSSTAQANEWDLGFLAVDPTRATTIAFTEPYVQIEGNYLAGPHCIASDSAHLVASRAAVGTVIGTAYTLTLQRLAGAEDLVIFRDINAALDALDDRTVAAVAGIGTVMSSEAARRPGARVLQPPFMQIRQAIALPQGRSEAHAIVAALLADLARQGVTENILERHGFDKTCAVISA